MEGWSSGMGHSSTHAFLLLYLKQHKENLYMAKRKSANEEIDSDFFEELAKNTGGDVLGKMDSVKYFVDTGSLALNYICSGRFIGGGVPGGKLTEIYGPSSSSKSLIGTNILFGCQRMKGIAILLDCENSANRDFINKASHCNVV